MDTYEKQERIKHILVIALICNLLALLYLLLT